MKDEKTDEMRVATYWRENRQLLAPREAEELTEEDYILLPSWVYGFVLRTRRWSKHSIAFPLFIDYYSHY